MTLLMEMGFDFPDGYLFSGALVRDTTIFWSMKMSKARRKPRPHALNTFIPVS